MLTTHRAYAEEAGDFRRIARFFMAHAAHLRTHATWPLVRFVDWKYGLYEHRTAVAGFCAKNACLWFDGFDELAGLALSEEGDEGFVILTAPGYRFLYPELLDWVLATWQDRGPHLRTEITARQTLEADALARAGFGLTESFFTQRFDLQGELPPRVPLAEGFRLVDMATNPDYRGQRILRDDAFSSRRGLSDAALDKEIEFYNHGHHGPIYHAPVDLCVMAPDGRLVAGCEALIDAHNVEADIERVCTHSEFRRRGFARAVIQECLYRVQAMGLARAYITGYSPAAIALYGSLGAGEASPAYVYAQGE